LTVRTYLVRAIARWLRHVGGRRSPAAIDSDTPHGSRGKQLEMRAQPVGDAVDAQAPEISNIRATRPSSDSSIVYPFSSRKRQHDDERESFVPIDERLILGNAPEQRGRLLSQVDIGVLSGMARSRHRRLDTPFVAQLACGFLDGKALDLGEESKGLLPIEVFVTFDVSVGRS